MTGMSRIRLAIMTSGVCRPTSENAMIDRRMTIDEELGAAALVGGRVLADLADGQRIAGLERVDRHVLGAVVLEDAPDVRRAPDEQQVAEEDRDPDQALDEVLDEAVVDAGGRDDGDEQRQQEEDPDRRPARVSASMRAIEPLPSSTPSSCGLDVRAADEPARADDERLVQDDEAADERPLRPARAVEAGVEALGGEDDVAVRVAQRDRDRVATAHQDALDEGLAAVGVGGHRGKSTGCARAAASRRTESRRRAEARRRSCRDVAATGDASRSGPGARGASGSARPGRPCR